MNVFALLLALLCAGCAVFGPSPEMLKSLAGDGACVGIVAQVNQPIYGTGGVGIARINSPGTVSVAKDGTITCTVAVTPPK
jgi:hypothetical protein